MTVALFLWFILWINASLPPLGWNWWTYSLIILVLLAGIIRQRPKKERT